MIWFTLVWFGAAYADVVGPDAKSCPPGSVGSSNHGGPFCVPAECADGCRDGARCESTSLCVLEEERACGGMTTPTDPCTYTHIEAFDECQTDADCAQGTCVTADRCVEEGGLGIGCSNSSTAPSLAFGLAAVGLGLLGRRRD